MNSPKTVYQIEDAILKLLRSFQTRAWKKNLRNYQSLRPTLVARYASERKQKRIPVRIPRGKEIDLSPGKHSDLIKRIIEEFGPRFVPGCKLIYVGDTGNKWAYFDENLLSGLGVSIDSHGKMPDVVLWYPKRSWLLLFESVTSHGPVDVKRHNELAEIFSSSEACLVYVTAFLTRSDMSRISGKDRVGDGSLGG